jgi:aminopeptidase N
MVRLSFTKSFVTNPENWGVAGLRQPDRETRWGKPGEETGRARVLKGKRISEIHRTSFLIAFGSPRPDNGTLPSAVSANPGRGNHPSHPSRMAFSRHIGPPRYSLPGLRVGFSALYKVLAMTAVCMLLVVIPAQAQQREAPRAMQADALAPSRVERVFHPNANANPNPTDSRHISAWQLSPDHARGIPHPRRHVLRGLGESGIGKHSPRRRQDAFDVTWYHLDLDLDKDRAPELRGSVRVVGRALTELDTLELDLARSMEVLSVTTSDGQALTWQHGVGPEADRLLIVPNGALGQGTFFDVSVTYQGDPAWNASRGGYQSGVRSGGDPYIWTLSEPYGSMEWWPTEDHPADKADSVWVTLTVPTGMTAASNGMLDVETENGDGTTTFEWRHRYPIATYLVSIAAGDYDRVVDFYVRPSDLEAEFGPATFPIEQYAYRDIPAVEGVNDASGWRLTAEAMAIQERWFGPYPFANEKYGNAHVTFRGGMEHQTVSSMGNIGIELIAHELAHQWYGDSLTPASWRHLWLNEGFATLGEMLTFEADPAFEPVREILFDLYYSRALEARGTLVLSDTTNAMDMFTHARVYAKGWMVLRMIRSRVGDATFRQILRAWAARADVKYSTAVTDQFRDVVTSVTGVNWTGFFDQWVYTGTGEPRWQLAWEESPEDAPGLVRVSLNQIQDRLHSNVDAFQILLPVWFETADVTYQVWLDIDERAEVFDVSIPSSVLAVHVDPERWVLRGETLMGTGTDTEALAVPLFHVQVAPHPAEGDVLVAIKGPRGDLRNAEMTIEVFDLIGRRVWKRVQVHASDSRLRIPDLSSGRYLLRVRQGSHVDEQVVVVRAH